jgi:hypothetical protein
MTARCLFEQLFAQLDNLRQIETVPVYLSVIDPLEAGVEPTAQVDDHAIEVLCQERPRQPVELPHAQQEIDLFVLHPPDAGEVSVELTDQLHGLGISYQCIGALALHRPKIQWDQERLGDCVQVVDRMCGQHVLII